ncbi:MAG: ATP-binding protein, partial [Geobacteraceae bacterium]|nr:ATP-binding protein [Geobacteraceae bacterium]
MMELVTIDSGELERLRERLRDLSRQKSRVELINVMYDRISRSSGLDAVIDTILNVLLESVGGLNLVFYHFRDGRWYSSDIYKRTAESEELADPLIREVVEKGCYIGIDSSSDPGERDLLPENCEYLWLFPLMVNERVIAVVRMEGMLLNTLNIRGDLESFFRYAALILNNEITSYSRLSRAQSQARESERRFRETLENMTLMAILLDRDGTIRFCNDCFLAATGWRREEMLNGNWFETFFPLDDSRKKSYLASLVDGNLESHQEHDIRTKAGESRLVSWNNTFLRDSSGKVEGVALIGEDITERRHLENHLRQAQKMESVGTLAGGIAHDFNNILTAIIGYGQLLERKVQGDPALLQNVLQIQSAAERAAGLTSRLLSFSRKQVIQKRPVDLNSIIQPLEKLLKQILGEDILLRTSLWPSDLIVLADSNQLEHVLINLASNARDAMPEGGLLTIGTKQLDMAEDYCRFHGFGSPGSYAVISVSDSGCGMPEPLRQRIFEPFFTTKETGKGTGLGLSMAYGIVQQHNGYINVYSEPGNGSTFRIYLPLEGGAAAESPLKLASISSGGTETVLLAEDDDSVRDLMKTVLGEAGYRVLEAANGLNAVKLFQEQREAVNLVILDVIMPGMNGKAVYDEVRKIH